MTTWTRINAVSGQSSSAGLRTQLLGWTPTLGNLLVFQYVNEQGSQQNGVADDQNGSYAQRYTNAVNGYGWADVVVTTAGTTTVTWTCPGYSAAGGAQQMWCISEWAKTGTKALDVVGAGMTIDTLTADALILSMKAVYPTALVGTGGDEIATHSSGASVNVVWQYYGSGGTSGANSPGSNPCDFDGGTTVADIAVAYKTTGGGAVTRGYPFIGGAFARG
jgi:hypothetical protein